MDESLRAERASTLCDVQTLSPERAVGGFLEVVCQSPYRVPGLLVYSQLYRTSPASVSHSPHDESPNDARRTEEPDDGEDRHRDAGAADPPPPAR